MELEHVSNLPARSVYVGAQSVTVSAGQTFKIESSPGGVEVLDVEIPAGKTWTVEVMVNISESEA